MKLWLAPLTTRDIVSLEIAQTIPKAEALMERFAAQGLIENLLYSIYGDFLFILLYCWLLIVAIRYLARLSGQDLLMRAARFFTFIVIMAGICDVIENILLLQMLSGRMPEMVVRMAYNFATAKFSMLIMTALLLLVELIFVALALLTVRYRVAKKSNYMNDL